MWQINNIIKNIRKFNNDRDRSQFHNLKDIALAISIETWELLELFLRKNPEDVKVEKLKEELADVLLFAFLMADKAWLDVEKIILEKIEKNSKKYPIEKSKGKATKYTDL